MLIKINGAVMFKKFNFILVLLLLILFFLSSCSKGDDNLTNNYWIKYKRGKPNYIVKFTKEGKFINFNRLENKFKYQIIQNRIIITKSSGEKQKFFIKVLTPKEMKLSEINDIGSMDIDYFKVAEIKDYFLGSWIKINKGENYKLTLESEGEGAVEEQVNEYIAAKPLKYSIKNDSIIFLNGIEYKFSFSEDIMDLELLATDGSNICLTRMK